MHRQSGLEISLTSALVHPVFHVSQLKGKLGTGVIPSPSTPIVPTVLKENPIPHLVIGRLIVPKGNVPLAQLLVQWRNQSPEDATWEDYEAAKVNVSLISFVRPRISGATNRLFGSYRWRDELDRRRRAARARKGSALFESSLAASGSS